MPGRLDSIALEAAFPGLTGTVAALDRVGLVMVKDQDGGMLLTRGGQLLVGPTPVVPDIGAPGAIRLA